MNPINFMTLLERRLLQTPRASPPTSNPTSDHHISALKTKAKEEEINRHSIAEGNVKQNPPKQISMQSSKTNSLPLAIGGDYAIIGPLNTASNQISRKYQALSTVSNKIRALWVVPVEDYGSVSRMMRMAPGMNEYRHRNLTRLFHLSRHNNHMIMAWEYCSFGSAYALVHRTTDGISEKRLIPIMKEILSALCYLHSRGQPHGDVIIRNILFSPKNVVKLHGIRVPISDDDDIYNYGVPRDVEFAAPEIVLEQNTKFTPQQLVKADIWSAGICFFIMATRTLNFTNSRIFVLNQSTGNLIPCTDRIISQLDSTNLSAFCRKLIFDMLKVDPTDRISAHEALRMLNEAPTI